MTDTVKAAVCVQLHTKHLPQSEHNVEFLNIKPHVTLKNR
jgi:hypothetical protein